MGIRIKYFAQTMKDAIGLPWLYKKSIKFLLRKEGLRSVYNFLFVKWFVVDEGGHMEFLKPIITMFPSFASYPFKIEVEHTTVCDKKCIICEHTYWDEKSETITIEQFKKIIDQFPGLKWMNITGEGSGFLNKDFLKMIEYARAKKISVNFVDEFDFIDEGKTKKLIELGVNCIWCSMDGATKETYEKIKVGCNFDRVLENIKTLIRLKKEIGTPFPVICFRFVVNKLNFHEMPKMVELVHSLGDLGEGSTLDFVGLLSFKEIEHLYMPEIPKDIFATTIKKAKEFGMKVAFSHGEESKLPPVEFCGAWHEPYIMIGGYVLPCCAVLMSNKREFLRKYAFGNLLEKPFKEIWYSERYRKFRKMVVKKNEKIPILCAGCRAYNTREREEKYGISTEI
ncbi:MAG: radical SAM protein [Candidatus Thermoplasmatota archaeon]